MPVSAGAALARHLGLALQLANRDSRIAAA